MQDDNIIIRIKLLIDKLGITNSTFADKCGISRATLSQMLTGRNKKISDVIISQIHHAFPNLSIMWLLFNEGKMWIHDDGSENEFDENTVETDLFNNETKGSLSGIGEDFVEDLREEITENPSENLNLRNITGVSKEERKESPFNSDKNEDNITQFKDVSLMIKNAELMAEIDNLKKKQKKVVQVTIYYDDSTFESFFPK